MNDDRYAPPNARLADPEPELGLERPRLVVRAVQLLWTAFAVSVVATLVSAFVSPSVLSPARMVVSTVINLLVQLAVAWWFNGAAWKGRGWSRWVQAVLSAFALIAIYYARSILPQDFAIPWYLEALSVLGTLVNAVAIGLLFTPGANAWYRATKAERARARAR